MAATPSTMLPLGTPLPAFQLATTEGKIVTPASYAGRPALVVAFLCNHCPFVKHLNVGLVEFAKSYAPKGVAMLAISSNDTDKYPADSFENMVLARRILGYPFDYALDPTQAVAKAFKAACTPDFYAFDAAGKLAYRGQFDPSRPGSGTPVTGADLRAAVDAILAGAAPSAEQKPSIGCNIKWIAGNEPDYFTRPA